MEFLTQQVWGTDCTQLSIPSSVFCCTPRYWSQRQLFSLKRRRQQYPFNPLLHHRHHLLQQLVNPPRPPPDPGIFQSKAPYCLLTSKPSALICFNNLHSCRRLLLKKIKKIRSKAAQEDTRETNFLPASGCYSLARNPAHSPTWRRASGHLFAHLIWEFWCTSRTLHGYWSPPSPYCVHLFAVDLYSVRVWQLLWKSSRV